MYTIIRVKTQGYDPIILSVGFTMQFVDCTRRCIRVAYFFIIVEMTPSHCGPDATSNAIAANDREIFEKSYEQLF